MEALCCLLVATGGAIGVRVESTPPPPGLTVSWKHVGHNRRRSVLPQMRFYRANQDIMDKAAMLYNRFKNAFLLGEGDEEVSAAFLRSLLQEKEREEEEEERCKKNERPAPAAAGDEEGEVPGQRPPSGLQFTGRSRIPMYRRSRDSSVRPSVRVLVFFAAD